MSGSLSVEQIAHDLAIAYATYIANKSETHMDIEPFLFEYSQAFIAYLEIVNKNR